MRKAEDDQLLDMMRRAATSHRRHFAHAVTLAAMGYHFRKLTESFGE
jgi:hypothetical protein